MKRFMGSGRRLVVLFCTLCCGARIFAQSLSPDAKMDAFVSNLLGKMTLDEKIGQLNLLSVGIDVTGPVVSKNVEATVQSGAAGGVFNLYTPSRTRRLQEMAVLGSRLHIPLLLGYDVIHGHKTIFPMPLGLAATWDLPLVEQSARIAANEATADGLNWTFSPMVDIARDPRWGRIAEGAGEDPYLGSLIAQAMVRGYQTDNLSQSNAIMACVKHFALYGAVEGGRDYNPADMSRLRMYQYYFPPYRAAVEAGVASVMSSFNEVDGLPATGDKWLMTDVLRKQWGFKGFVVTDYTSIMEMTAHGLGDLRHNAALALEAGIDMDMVSEAFIRHLKRLVEDKTIPESLVDTACRRLLEAKYRLGLFDDPFRASSDDRAAREILSPSNLAFARQAAARACVLLKDDHAVLPLQKSGVIALIGPLAADHRNLLGSWSAAGDWKKDISVLDAVKEATGSNATILYARGANLIDDSNLVETLNASGADVATDKRSPQEMIDEAVATAKRADTVVAVLGESFAMTGEAASRSDISLPDCQKELLRALVQTGKPVALVLMNGRPLTLTWEDAHCAAILETWFGGSEAGHGISDVLFGDDNPSARLTATFPRSVGQIPLYYNHKNTGRPYLGNPRVKYVSRYLDIPNTPLYPFGYGLSYTTFSYGDVTVNKKSLTGGDMLEAAVNVSNTGPRAGVETVQFYLTQPVASVTRSVEDLRGFQQILLQPGQSTNVVFRITTDDLKFYNSDLVFDWEPGDFIIRLGPNSSDLHSVTVHWSR